MSSCAADIAKLWYKYGIPTYLPGASATLLVLALVATAIGCIIGLVCGILEHHPPRQERPARPSAFFLKPWSGSSSASTWRSSAAPPWCCRRSSSSTACRTLPTTPCALTTSGPPSILIVSINTGAYMAESVRGGIISIDPGQTEGAKAIGMTHCPDHDQRHPAPGHPQYPPPDRQQLHHQRQGYLRHVHHRLHRSSSAAHRYIVGVNNMYFPSAVSRDGRLPHS